MAHFGLHTLNLKNWQLTHSILTNDRIPQVLCDDTHIINVHKVQVVFHRRAHHLPQHQIVAMPSGDHQHGHAFLLQLGHWSNHITRLHPIRQPHQHSWETHPGAVYCTGSQHPLLCHSQRLYCVCVPPERFGVPQRLLKATLGAMGVKAKLEAWVGAHLQKSYPHLVLSQREGEEELRQEGEHAGVLVG